MYLPADDGDFALILSGITADRDTHLRSKLTRLNRMIDLTFLHHARYNTIKEPDKHHTERRKEMKQNRRRFIKHTSLAFGASVLGAPYLVRGQMFHGASNHEIQGNVFSGNGATAVPLPGAEVRLYEATRGAPRLLGMATTNGAGNFLIQIRSPDWGADGTFYVTADLVGGLQLVSIIGPSLLPFVAINELTTVTAGYSFAQFATEGVVSGDEFGLQIAAGMNENLVVPATGESSPVITSSPNADQTNSWRSTLSLANLLALFVQNNGDSIDSLYDLATPPGGSPPVNLLQTLSNIARFPQQNVSQLYALATQVSVYTPTLASQPDAWTIVVKVNDSGDDNYLIGGPGNIAFDDYGYAWVTNNVVQGTGDSGRFNFVLKPNGKPADGKGGAPTSPLLGGGLLGAGIGIGFAPNGHVWWGNFGWGLRPEDEPRPHGNGSISEFTKNGHPISGPLGYQGGPVRVQGIMPDAEGNIWIASFGNSRVYVFLKGNPNCSIYWEDPCGNAQAPFGLQVANDGTAWVTFSGGLKPGGQGYVGRFALKHGRLEKIFLTPVGQTLKLVALDSCGQGWVASSGDGYVYCLDGDGNIVGSYSGGSLSSPWGITVDGDDNVWVGNFGPQDLQGDYTNAGVTKLAGSNPATRPPGTMTGDQISPFSSGYTLPSAGDEVLLHNGDPLYDYGPNALENVPCYSPLMRMTATTIDRAGNLWTTNNWKPPILIDAFNPGGDGICIFVGLAKPPAVNSQAGPGRGRRSRPNWGIRNAW